MTDEPTGSVAASTSARVQAILEAAESGADEIRREAEADAERIRAQAHRDVSDSLAATVGRLQALHAELGAVIESLGAPTPAPAAAGEQDGAGVRLIALNMALGGTPREELAAYLAEHYGSLADPEALLDDVYASVGG